jgi:hypothetical protein
LLEQLGILVGDPDGIEAHQHVRQGRTRPEFDRDIPRFGSGPDDENASRPESGAAPQIADAAHGDEAEDIKGTA